MFASHSLAQAHLMTKHDTKPQTIVRASDPRGLVSAVPALFGYRPENSIVVLPTRRKRSYGGARIELAQAEHPRRAARTLVGQIVSKFRPESIIVAVYTDERLPVTIGESDVPLIDTRVAGIPYQAVVDAFRDEAARLSVPTVVALYVGPDGFCEYAPPLDEQSGENPVVQFWAHSDALTHPELVGLPLERDPRAVERESDAKARLVMQRLQTERNREPKLRDGR